MTRPQGTLGAALVALAAMLAGATGAAAEELPPPTREQYRLQVEPICKRDAESNSRILHGARKRVNHGKFKPASRQFFHATKAFGRTVKALRSIPRPTADDARLMKWLHFLGKIKEYLRKTGKALKEEEKIKAVHETIRAERAGNAANNVSSVFEFHDCRLSPSRFR